MSLAALDKEWERIETLAGFLIESRKGTEIEGDRLEQLRDLQESVLEARRCGAWSGIVQPELDRLEYDVLACAIAPEISPRLAWMYQSLHGRSNEFYPTLHFLQELLSLEPGDTPALYAAVDEEGRLRRDRLIRLDGSGPLSTVQPAPGVTERLIDRPFRVPAPPGTTPVLMRATWKDLVLPEGQIEMLREFLAYLTCRHTVVEEWGGNPCGGPIALFSGASGTGKTYAASVLAGALGWPLFRVDLGRLVSKYVGETEKNLNALFDAAHDMDMILQFDEADSLFSKRGQVKEARDRYANLEVSHLLARIEVHRGPCILTTNLRDQLDPAFARRFQVVIDFPKPDGNARRVLWERQLPARAPLDPSVDLDLIAHATALTGGNIRNAALHAAVLAAHAGTPITLHHITKSIWRELAKEGRPVNLSEIGALSPFLAGSRS